MYRKVLLTGQFLESTHNEHHVDCGPARSEAALCFWKYALPFAVGAEASCDYLEHHLARVGPERNATVVAAFVQVVLLEEYFDGGVFPLLRDDFLAPHREHDVVEALQDGRVFSATELQ